MTPYYKMPYYYDPEGTNCIRLQSIFFYDSQKLYFIDVFTTKKDNSFHWGDQKHLTFVDRPYLGEVDVVPDNPKKVMNLSWFVQDAYAVATVSIGYRDGRFLLDSYEMRSMGSDVADLEGGTGGDNQEVSDEVFTKICAFSDYSIADCAHLMFDCGDFGNAKLSSDLDQSAKDLWRALVVSDTDGERGNPKYVEKKFEIKYRMVMGTSCGEPDANGNYYRDGPV